MCLVSISSSSWRRRRASGPWKTGFSIEGVVFFACPAFARGTKKRRNFEEKQSKNIRKCNENTRRNTSEKHQNLGKMSQNGSQNRSRRPPEASSEPGWRPEAPKIASGEPQGGQNVAPVLAAMTRVPSRYTMKNGQKADRLKPRLIVVPDGCGCCT